MNPDFRTRAILAVSLLALLPAVPVLAQRSDMGKTPITTNAVRDASGGSIIVRNPTAQTVLAFSYIYTMRTADASVVYAANGFYDSLIEPNTQPAIQPGQEIHIPYRVPFADANPVAGVDGVIFSDGSTFGEPNVVKTLYDRRNYTVVSLNRSIADLKQALADGTSISQLINQFQQTLAIDTSNAADQELAGCIQQVRSQVVAALFTSRRPNGVVPPAKDVIQAQLDSLNARREALRAGMAKDPGPH
jgi:hypothetical protein